MESIEDRLHVRRRAADDAKHLGCRRLMLQRFAQFRVALLEFLEQPDVFDSDHGLRGEGLQQFDLLVREGRTSLDECKSLPIGPLPQQRDGAR